MDWHTSESPEAPPRANGELVFESPWQSRVFGLAVALRDAGVVDWEEFRQSLIDQIRRWEQADPASRPQWSYYTCWQSALEALLARRGIEGQDALRERCEELERRPHGHDHDHPHTHDHDHSHS